MQWGCVPGFDFCLISPKPWYCLWIINRYSEKQFRSLIEVIQTSLMMYFLLTLLQGKVVLNNCAFLLFEIIWKQLVDVDCVLIFKQNAEYKFVLLCHEERYHVWKNKLILCVKFGEVPSPLSENWNNQDSFSCLHHNDKLS